MLRTMRAAAKTKVASVIIGALILAFALWGVNDIFRGAIANVVAEVGDTNITGPQFDREFRNRLNTVVPGVQLTVEQGRAMQLDQTVLNGMISRAALDQRARDLGLTASDAIVADYIRTSPQFGAGQGGFNPMAFAQAIRQEGYTEGEYVELMRDEIGQTQLLGSVGADVPAGLTRILNEITNETRTPEYILLTPEDAGTIATPSAMDLENFHRAHPELYSAPEYRGLDYVGIGPEQVADKVQVTDDELRNEYAAQQATYETPERREIEQISFPDKAAADAAAARLKMGTSFATIAQERGLKDEDYKLGSLPATGLDAQLSGPAFALPEGQFSEPVQGPFGWVILRVAAIAPATTKSFEEMEPALREALTRTRAAVHVQELADALEDELASGASLTDSAMKLGIPVKHIVAVDNMGKTPEGTAADVPMQPAFLEQVFTMEEGDESDPFRVDEDHTYVVALTDITPSALKPLEQVRDAVREAWEMETRMAALRTRAEAIAAQARAGSLADAARSLGKTPTMGMKLRRDQPSDVLSDFLKQQLFSEPEGSILVGEAPSGMNYVVVRVADVEHPPADTTTPEYEQFRMATRQEMARDMIETVAAVARQDAGVTVHPEVLQQFLGEPAQ